MSISINEFESFFTSVYGYAPFPWQSRLTRQVFQQGWPKCIDLPTASGKTAAIDIAVFVLAAQAGRPTSERTVGRRIFFAVNRRVIVDEAHERAMKLAEKLLQAKDGIIGRVADALGSINGDTKAPPLDVAELRGGIFRDRRWARGITQPIVVATTADQLGSRLLFRGYGVSSVMQPIHAALAACDSTILLDEAHVTRAFSQTLRAIAGYRKHDTSSPPMHFVQMTATPTDVPPDERFTLDSADIEHSTLAKRLNASKPAELVALGKVKYEKFVRELVDRAIKSVSEQRTAVGIIVNRVQTARDVHAELKLRLSENEIDADAHLVIGRMRPIDRDGLTQSLRAVVGPERPPVLSKHCFVIATQCLEVGADYDFDVLITECAPIDSLRQRFGRLNRKGRPIETVAVILTTTEALKGDDPVYGDALKKTWEWLTHDDRKSLDFGITAFQPLWDLLSPKDRGALSAPAPDAAVLLPAHLDALCQTAPPPVPSPDVSYFIHGPQRENADVQVCWRADLGDNHGDWADIVSLLPPTSPECMTVPIRALRKWMGITPQIDADADVPMRSQEESEDAEFAGRHVLIWRGITDSRPTSNPPDICPGDTIVIPVASGGWNELGHIPDAPFTQPPQEPEAIAEWKSAAAKIDNAEQAIATSRRHRIMRIHRDLSRDHIPQELFEHAMSENGTLSKSRIRELTGGKGRIEEVNYPSASRSRPGIVLRFLELLPQDDRLRAPVLEEGDDDDSSSELGVVISLAEHTGHVVEAINLALSKLHMTAREACLRRAAELHDFGKADVRFQAMLLGSTPEEASLRPTQLGKGIQRDLSMAERRNQKQRAKLPDNFRHEMLSVEMIQFHHRRLLDSSIDIHLLLHLVAAHHGHARPFAPVVDNDVPDDLLELSVDGISLSAMDRRQLVPAHWLDSGVAERFWKLTRRHGWWGLAYLESILRVADQQASEAEQNQTESK